MKTGMYAVVKQYPWDTTYTVETLKVAQVCRAEIISKHRTYEAAKRALIRNPLIVIPADVIFNPTGNPTYFS